MNFIAHDFWSLVWMASLLAASIVVLFGKSRNANAMIVMMWGNWLGTRFLVSFDKGNDVAWLVLEFATVAAFLILATGRVAKAVAGCFFIILAMNTLQSADVFEFAQTAAVADALGFLMLFMIGGAAHVGPSDGKLARFFNRVGFGLNRLRAVGSVRRETL